MKYIVNLLILLFFAVTAQAAGFSGWNPDYTYAIEEQTGMSESFNDLYVDYTNRQPFSDDEVLSESFVLSAPGDPSDPGDFPLGDGLIELGFLILLYILVIRKKQIILRTRNR